MTSQVGLEESYDFTFIVENLRIGGIQRLVLDECYQLIEWGYSTRIISLSPSIVGDSILEVDSGYPLSQKISVTHLEQNKKIHLLYCLKLVGSSRKGDLLITHSASATPFIRLASSMLRKKVNITLFIHQLLTLSDAKQKTKRFIYSLFANEIVFSSKQFLLDWSYEISHNPLLKIVFQRNMKFDRMGVYLPRLDWGAQHGRQLCNKKLPHLVFMSRISSWKGSTSYIEICNRNLNANLHAIAFISRTNRTELFNADEFISSNSHVVYESGLTMISIDPMSVHIYPSDYGSKVRFPQSIGMNVLEMLSRGIPSLISQEGFESWPELRDSSLIYVVNWRESEHVDQSILSALKTSYAERKSEAMRLRGVISIENHCKDLIERKRKIF